MKTSPTDRKAKTLKKLKKPPSKGKRDRLMDTLVPGCASTMPAAHLHRAYRILAVVIGRVGSLTVSATSQNAGSGPRGLRGYQKRRREFGAGGRPLRLL
jgi:hypothetical protein